jgi:hypothetical protein
MSNQPSNLTDDTSKLHKDTPKLHMNAWLAQMVAAQALWKFTMLLTK